MFSSLRLWVRLALAFGVLLALQLTMAGAGLQQLGKLAALDARQAELTVLQQQVMQWTAHTRLNVARTLALAKAGSPPSLAAWLDGEMKQTSAQISELHKKLEPGLASAEEKALLVRVAAARKTYVDLRAALLKRLADPATAAAAVADIDGQLMPVATAYLGTLEAVSARVTRESQAQDGALAQARQQAWRVLVALAAASVLVGVVLSVLISRSLVRPIRAGMDAVRRIAAGDLAHPVTVDRHDELGELQAALAEMQDSLRTMVSGIRTGTENVTVATAQIASGNQDLNARTEQAASSLQQTAATMAGLNEALQRSVGSAQDAAGLVDAAAVVARRGGAVVAQVVTTMAEINAGSSRISEITGVIDGIAFQTNILALNAAVEAARAGEQGRGFAVVAAEVRSLAQRSADAAKEIKDLIEASVHKVEAGSRLVGDAGATMKEIEHSVRDVTEAIGGITAAAAGQASGIGEVSQAVAALDRLTQQNAALVEQATAAAHSLKDQAGGLSRMVSSFRLAPGFAPA